MNRMGLVHGFGGLTEDSLESSTCLISGLNRIPCIPLVLGGALERLLGLFEVLAGVRKCVFGLFMGRLGSLQLCTELLGLLFSVLDNAALIANPIASGLNVDLVLADLLEQGSGFTAGNLVDVGIYLHQLLVECE